MKNKNHPIKTDSGWLLQPHDEQSAASSCREITSRLSFQTLQAKIISGRLT